MKILPNILAKKYVSSILSKQKQLGYKGRESSPTHLNSAIVEWNIKGYWNNNDTVIISFEDKGFVFLLYTFQKDINGIDKLYCEIRHIVTLEQYREQGTGRHLVEATAKHMKERDCQILKVLSDIKSKNFYIKNGFEVSGITKHGLPYFCNDITSRRNASIPASDFPFMTNSPKSIL